MPPNKKVISPTLGSNREQIAEKVISAEHSTNLIINFTKLKLKPVCLQGKFNNHFKNDEHFASVAASFLGVILPKIMSHTYKEISDGGTEKKMLHFHTVDDSHRKIVREVLEEYHIPAHAIDQMFEGNDIVEFAASLGHIYAARIVCHRVNNILFPLFFDTNHHIYINEKYVKESMFYEDCPAYLTDCCKYMPSDCFAVGCLDEALLKETYGYSYSPE